MTGVTIQSPFTTPAPAGGWSPHASAPAAPLPTDSFEPAAPPASSPLLTRMLLAGLVALTPVASTPIATAPPATGQVVALANPQAAVSQNHVAVALLDVFPTHGEVTHGKMVQATLEQFRGETDLETRPVALGDSMAELDQERPGALDRYIESRLVTPVAQTARRLDELAASGQRMVIGQSQGASDSRIVEALWSRAHEPSFRRILGGQLGLPRDASDHDLLAALVSRVEQVHARSTALDEARTSLLDAVAHLPGGSIRVLSAGNQGELDRLLGREGIRVSPGFYRSELADPQAIIVGAADVHGTKDYADDTAADIASPRAGAVLAAQGVDLEITMDGRSLKVTGSSYAEPQVTAAVERLLEQHPELDRNGVVERLVAASHPIPGAEDRVGAGILDVEGLLSSPR